MKAFIDANLLIYLDTIIDDELRKPYKISTQHYVIAHSTWRSLTP